MTATATKTTSASDRQHLPKGLGALLKLARGLLGLSAGEFQAAKVGLKRFERFCQKVTTEDGAPFRVDPWQRLVLLAYFAGITEILILLPKGNGKTTLLAALAVFHLLTHPYPEAYIGASTKDQAAVMYGQARRISQLHAAWRKRLIARPSTKHIYVGRGAADGFLRVLSSDRLGRDEEDGSGALVGIKPTLGLVDELHAHVNDAIYAAIQGALHKRDGQMLTISTAGADMGSLLKQIRDIALKYRNLMRRGRLTAARQGAFLMLEWALGDKDDRENMTVVKLANPATFITERTLSQLRASPSMKGPRWARRHCNLWGHSEGAWIEAELYDAGEEAEEIEIPTDRPIILGYDHARSYDHAALVALIPTDAGGGFVPIESYDPETHEGGRGKVVVLDHLKPDEQDGGKVPYWKAKKAIRDACKRYTVAAVGYDNLGGFSQSAEELEDEGLPMVAVSMKGNVWAPLTAELYSAIEGGRLRHGSDADLRAHVLAGETKDSEWGERLHGKPKSREKVDCLMATGIAWFTAFFDPEALAALTAAPATIDPDDYRIATV